MKYYIIIILLILVTLWFMCRSTPEEYTSTPPPGYVYVGKTKSQLATYVRNFINAKNVRVGNQQMYPQYKYIAITKTAEIFAGKELPTDARVFRPSLKTSTVFYTYKKQFYICDVNSYGPCIPTDSFKASVLKYKVNKTGRCIPASCAPGYRLTSDDKCRLRRAPPASPWMPPAPAPGPFPSDAPGPAPAPDNSTGPAPTPSDSTGPAPAPDNSTDPPITIEDVAAAFGMSVSEFQQYLIDAGMTFDDFITFNQLLS
jgi:hypothetical protein